MPAGHTADAAYWFDDLTGNFVTNQFYMEQLPEWVTRFNEQERAEEYMKRTWEFYLEPEAYEGLAAPDDSPGEGLLPGAETPTLPYHLPTLREKGGVRVVKTTPYGNRLTTDFAIGALQEEQLGLGNHTDMLLISYSSPDYIGHLFGPHSLEIADNYVRLDREIERLLNFIELTYGREQVLVFLTADHGAAQAPAWMASLGIPSRTFDYPMIDTLKGTLQARYQLDLVEYFTNSQVYLNHEAISEAGLDLCEVQEFCASWLIQQEGVATAATACDLRRNGYSDPVLARLKAGYYPKRSGDVFVVTDPGVIDMDWSKSGTTHGTVYTFDTQVPLLFWGFRVPQGQQSVEPVNITDIAPTVARLMRIGQPTGCVGRVLFNVE